MRIIVDRDRCVGHGICESIVPEVFEVLDEGYVHIHEDAIGDADFASVFARIDASYVAPSAWYLGTTEYRYSDTFAPSGSMRLDIHKDAVNGCPSAALSIET